MNEIEIVKRCTYRNASVEVSEIATLEQSIGVRLPEDYKRFLGFVNGGHFSSIEIRTPWHPNGGDELEILYGVGDSSQCADDEDEDELLGNTIDIFDDNAPVRFLPFGDTRLGHLLIMEFTDGEFEQILIKQAFGNVEVFCPSFSEFLNRLAPTAS